MYSRSSEPVRFERDCAAVLVPQGEEVTLRWKATKAGTFIFEPAGETHTLVVRPDEGHMLVLFHNFGPLLHVDADGSVVGYEDVFTRLAKVRAHFRKVGLGDQFVDEMIR